MIFWAITPILIGAFGNLTIPLMIGARDMAFPRLNMYSYWMFFISGVFVVLSWTSPLGAASAGWTTYPPLSTNVGSPGWGQTYMRHGHLPDGRVHHHGRHQLHRRR